MNRLKIYRLCLIAALILSILLFGLYGKWYLNTRIPDVIRVGEGEEQTLNLGIKEVSVQAVQKQRVIPGGIPVGIYLETDGVYVVGTAEVESADGLMYEPAYQIIQTGDYILAVNGRQIHDKDELIECVQACQTDIMILKVLRGTEVIQVRISAVETEENYKLGIWVKDDIQGIGTLTYVTEDLQFGALGHGITDTDTGELLDVSGGSLYDTSILEIVKGESGEPGEISGMITYSARHERGSITKNTRSPSHRLRVPTSSFGTQRRIPSLQSSSRVPVKASAVYRHIYSVGLPSAENVTIPRNLQDVRISPVSSFTSLSRHSSGLSPGSKCPPTPIHLPSLMSCSFFIR